MKQDELDQMIRDVEAGKLSRNKNLHRFECSDFKRAHDRARRLRGLRVCLNQVADDNDMVKLVDSRRETFGFKLRIHFPNLSLFWTASVADIEWRLLKESPHLAAFMDSIECGTTH